MQTLDAVSEAMQQLYPDMIRWRRHLHQYPEVSFHEQATSNWIAARLTEMGCSVRTEVGGHGLVVKIQGDLPGPAVAIRADMDALPIQDEKTCDYASKIPNVMHACGHDAHTATLLAVASYYLSNRSQLRGERRLLFQPAEEIAPGGALPMINDGALDGVDAIYGVHLWTPIPYGRVASKPGPIMAAADEFMIEISGRGGHGGMPHEANDSIIIGASLVSSIQSIVSRNVNPQHPAVVTIGSFQAGTANNVIAEKCQLKGTIRTYDESTRKMIHERMEALIKHTCEMYNAQYEYKLRIGYPAVVNSEPEAERFFKVSESLFGEAAVMRADAVTAAEDFAYYLQRVPGCFMFVGAGNADCGASYVHHHPRFDVDERSMLQAARLLIGMADSYANENA